jgi:hypothetical protein
VSREKISIIISGISILSVITINYIIAERYLNVSDKSRAFFSLIETDYWYRHLFIIPGLVAFVIAYKGSNGTTKGIAYTLALLTIIVSLIDVWKIYV